jgi:hypothetical protein
MRAYPSCCRSPLLSSSPSFLLSALPSVLFPCPSPSALFLASSSLFVLLWMPPLCVDFVSLHSLFNKSRNGSYQAKVRPWLSKLVGGRKPTPSRSRTSVPLISVSLAGLRPLWSVLLSYVAGDTYHRGRSSAARSDRSSASGRSIQQGYQLLED